MATPRRTPEVGTISIAGSALSRLKLPENVLSALRRQGFVQSECRGRKRIVFKLRYRISGSQRVCCLGSDASLARAVRAELHQLQAWRKHRRNLLVVQREATAFRRGAKSLLARYAQQVGMKLHGFAVRQPRKKRTTETELQRAPNCTSNSLVTIEETK